MNTGNGSKLIWWIMVTAVGLLTSGGILWLTTLSNHVEALQASTLLMDTKREGQISILSTQMTEALRRLGSLEDKQDAMFDFWKRKLGNK